MKTFGSINGMKRAKKISNFISLTKSSFFAFRNSNVIFSQSKRTRRTTKIRSIKSNYLTGFIFLSSVLLCQMFLDNFFMTKIPSDVDYPILRKQTI